MPNDRLDEMVATPEEWETDPFGVAAAIIREACEKALSYDGAMSESEMFTLRNTRREYS